MTANTALVPNITKINDNASIDVFQVYNRMKGMKMDNYRANMLISILTKHNVFESKIIDVMHATNKRGFYASLQTGEMYFIRVILNPKVSLIYTGRRLSGMRHCCAMSHSTGLHRPTPSQIANDTGKFEYYDHNNILPCTKCFELSTFDQSQILKNNATAGFDDAVSRNNSELQCRTLVELLYRSDINFPELADDDIESNYTSYRDNNISNMMKNLDNILTTGNNILSKNYKENTSIPSGLADMNQSLVQAIVDSCQQIKSYLQSPEAKTLSIHDCYNIMEHIVRYRNTLNIGTFAVRYTGIQ